jgi:hypothetical protein
VAPSWVRGALTIWLRAFGKALSLVVQGGNESCKHDSVLIMWQAMLLLDKQLIISIGEPLQLPAN